MASFCVYYKGERIKTNILVSAWISNLKRANKMLIPRDIIDLCFTFWFIDVCDEWDKKYIDDADVTLQGQCITMKNTWDIPQFGAQRSFYGCHCVGDGIYEWIIRFNTDMRWICIGIIEDEHEFLKEMVKDGNGYKTEGRGWFLMHNGTFYSQNDGITSGFHAAFKAKGNIISTRADMNTYELSYKINEEDWKVATKLLKKDVKYRFVVTLLYEGNQIELL